MKSVVVITPTIGHETLGQAIASVKAQSYKNIKHLIVADGPEFFKKTVQIVSTNPGPQVTFTPINTGGKGFYGHRIYSAFPHLVDEDYVVFLDEDNWFHENHIEYLVGLIERQNLDFAYSLRQVYIGNEFHALDMCESIGRWPIWFTQTGEDCTPDYLVDTSAYCFRREWLIQHCQKWHSGWGGDRKFFKAVKDEAKYDTTGLHSLYYRLPDMQKSYGGDMQFFEKGNEAVKNFYGGKYPWQT